MLIKSIKVQTIRADGSTTELNYMFTGEQTQQAYDKVCLVMSADANSPAASYAFSMPAVVWAAIKDRS